VVIVILLWRPYSGETAIAIITQYGVVSTYALLISSIDQTRHAVRRLWIVSRFFLSIPPTSPPLTLSIIIHYAWVFRPGSALCVYVRSNPMIRNHLADSPRDHCFFFCLVHPTITITHNQGWAKYNTLSIWTFNY